MSECLCFLYVLPYILLRFELGEAFVANKTDIRRSSDICWKAVEEKRLNARLTNLPVLDFVYDTFWIVLLVVLQFWFQLCK